MELASAAKASPSQASPASASASAAADEAGGHRVVAGRNGHLGLVKSGQLQWGVCRFFGREYMYNYIYIYIS